MKQSLFEMFYFGGEDDMRVLAINKYFKVKTGDSLALSINHFFSSYCASTHEPKLPTSNRMILTIIEATKLSFSFKQMTKENWHLERLFRANSDKDRVFTYLDETSRPTLLKVLCTFNEKKGVEYQESYLYLEDLAFTYSIFTRNGVNIYNSPFFQTSKEPFLKVPHLQLYSTLYNELEFRPFNVEKLATEEPERQLSLL